MEASLHAGDDNSFAHTREIWVAQNQTGLKATPSPYWVLDLTISMEWEDASPAKRTEDLWQKNK